MDRIWKKWQDITSEIRLKETVASILGCSPFLGLICSEGSQVLGCELSCGDAHVISLAHSQGGRKLPTLTWLSSQTQIPHTSPRWPNLQLTLWLTRGTWLNCTWIVTHRNQQVINVCCFKLLNLGESTNRERAKIQFSSLTQSCPTLCNPMECSMPGFPVLHQLLKLAQTHMHQVSDAIQSPHPLLSPSPPAFNLSQHQSLF